MLLCFISSVVATVIVLMLLIPPWKALVTDALAQWLTYAISVILLISGLRLGISKVYEKRERGEMREKGHIRFLRSWTYVDYFNIFIYLLTGTFLVFLRVIQLPFILVSDIWRLDRPILPSRKFF